MNYDKKFMEVRRQPRGWREAGEDRFRYRNFSIDRDDPKRKEGAQSKGRRIREKVVRKTLGGKSDACGLP